MPKEQRTFTKEFQLEAVQLVHRSGKSQSQVARELGIADSTLHHWCKEFADHGQQAFVGSGHQTPQEMELAAKRRRHKPVGTIRTRGAPVAPNVLGREFEAQAPNSKWVSDTTFVWTAEGWLYVAVILDLFSRLVVGWAMSQHNDESLVRQALEMAVARRCPPKEMLVHSDQGSPYTSSGYLHRLRELLIVVGMSRVGDCYDHAAMESFFSTFKGECVERHTFRTRQEARSAIFEYIGCFYNRVRRHSTLNYLSPVAYEQQMR